MDRSSLRPLSVPRFSRGVSAVAKGSVSCWPFPLTGTAFPPPGRFPGLGPPFGGLLVLCGPPTSAGSLASVFRPRAYRHMPEPSRSPRVRHSDFATIPSPIHTEHRQILGFVAARRLTRSACLTALHSRSKRSHTYGFHQTPLRRPPDPLPPAFTTESASLKTAFLDGHGLMHRERESPGYPEQRPCLLGVGFPLSGPQDRICITYSPPG